MVTEGRRSNETSDDFYASHMPSAEHPESVLESIWNKPLEVREYERKQFSALRSHKDSLSLAQLTNCYAWTQSKNSVTFVVWLQGSLDETIVDVKEPAHVLVQTEGYAPVIDSELAHAIDSSQDMDSVSWDNFDMIAFKVFKKTPGECWQRLFKTDTHAGRAVDLKPYSWVSGAEEEELALSVQTFGGEASATISSERLEVRCAGWEAPLVKHFKWPVDADASAWTRSEVGLELLLRVRNPPTMRKTYRRIGDDLVEAKDGDLIANVPDIALLRRMLFVEDEDGMLTGVVAEMMAYMDYGESRWRKMNELSTLSQSIFKVFLPPHLRDQYAFDDTDELADPQSILEWWEEQDASQPAVAESGDKVDDDPVVEVLNDVGDDHLLPTASPPPPLPPGGMLGSEPVRISRTSSLLGRTGGDGKPRHLIADYAFDSSNATVKVYVDFKAPVDSSRIVTKFTSNSASVDLDCEDHTVSFETKLAHTVDPDRCTIKLKLPTTVVILLKKTDPAIPWGPMLKPDVNAYHDD